MFDNALPDLETLGEVDDTMLVAAITGWTQVEAAAAARRLAAVAELVRRRSDGRTDCSRWSCDNWDAMAAEVAAAQHISHGMASGQMYLAVALRDRLPRVGALFAEGMISARLVSAIAWHTVLIQDDGALRLVDEALAESAIKLGPLSVTKTADAIDALVDRYDPGALRHTRSSARSREVVIDTAHGEAGTTALWGRLYSVDGATLDRRLTQLAHGVCDDDPRTFAQRRADALGALAAGAEQLACSCGSPECSAASADERAAGVAVYVVAEAAALEATPDRHMSGDGPASRPITPDMTLTEALTPDPEPDPPTVRSPAAIVGGGMVPAPLLAELIRGGAKVKPLWYPENMPPEVGYRPSAALEAFVRCRDMTCRFPGCDRPATYCDIDHATAYPFGPTHPSNLRCLCRKHHLLKTFWTGPDGWADQQLPDATIVWTAPNGQTYTTRPGSRLLFPTLCLPTGQIPAAATQNERGDRGIMMPTRKRTRAQDRVRRIDAERAHNAAHVAERNRPPPF